jgi:hypothetical protein
MKSKMVLLLAISVLASSSAFASAVVCKPSESCNQLKQAITQVKAEKGKRHKDVKKFGRESAQVKADDQALLLAVRSDRNVRTERKIGKQPGKGMAKGTGKGKRRVHSKGTRNPLPTQADPSTQKV